jgi:hypothetical protein
MSATEYAPVLAKTELASLQLPALLHAGLPKVVADVAEVSGAEAEVVCLALAAVAALPAEEFCAVLRALKLALGRATSAHELHGQSGLHVVIQIVLLLFLACALNLSAVVRLIALRTFEERHLRHRQSGYSILIGRIVGPRRGPPLLDHPALQCLPSDLLVHCELWCNVFGYGTVLHDGLAERALYALEGQPSATSVALLDHGLGTMVM